ncbi:MAG TPA: response regulator [Steroidobacteraceae bacterium]|jgi:two-component system chemotaxis response regulator CheY
MAKKILVVDDSASVRTVARMALREKGYEVVEACNGQEGLQVLGGERVHLVISDVNMPTMDGITFLKELKRNPGYKFTPVIMLTTEAGEDKKQEGRAAGAKAWITKPFQPQVLVDAVSKLIMA